MTTTLISSDVTYLPLAARHELRALHDAVAASRAGGADVTMLAEQVSEFFESLMRAPRSPIEIDGGARSALATTLRQEILDRSFTATELLDRLRVLSQ